MPSWVMGQVGTYAGRLVAERLADFDARGYHYRLLAALTVGPASQAELGRRTGIDRSDIVAAVNELDTSGFVARTRDPGDRRRNVVSALPAGLAQLRRLDRVLVEVQDELLGSLAVDERVVLVELLRRVLAGNTPRTGP